MKRGTFIMTGLLLMSLVLTAACGGQTSKTPNQPASTPEPKPAAEAPKPAPSPVKLTFSLGYTTTLETLAPQIAVDKGFFKEVGLDVDFVEYSGGSAMQQAFAAGEAKIGISASTTIVQGAFKGVPVKMVALAADPLMEYVVVRPDLKLTDPKQLAGKTIGVTRQGSLTEMEAKLVTDAAGLKADQFKIAPLGTVQAMRAALEEKKVDAAVMFGPLVAQMVVDKTGQILVKMADVVPAASNEMIVASEKFIKEKPDQIKAFLKAYFKAMKWMKQNPDETIKIVSTSFKINPEVAKEYYNTNIKYMSEDGAINMKGLEWTAQSAQSLKLIDGKPDLAKMIAPEFTPVK